MRSLNASLLSSFNYFLFSGLFSILSFCFPFPKYCLTEAFFPIGTELPRVSLFLVVSSLDSGLTTRKIARQTLFTFDDKVY